MKILLVEDDDMLRRATAKVLDHAGFAVDLAESAREASYRVAVETYDAIVLDLGLPDHDGIEILKQWRDQGLLTPVLILTVRDAWSDKVRGFRAGADDYVTKPFNPEEVALRLQAIIRRACGKTQALLRCGALSLDVHAGLFALSGLPLKLTAYEARILSHLMHHSGRVVSRTELSEHIYASDAVAEFNSIEVMIARLRRKVGRDRIATVRGQGYRLDHLEDCRDDID